MSHLNVFLLLLKSKINLADKEFKREGEKSHDCFSSEARGTINK
jgi:hypothetical protein